MKTEGVADGGAWATVCKLGGRGREGMVREGMSLAAASYAKVVNHTPRQHLCIVRACVLCLPLSVLSLSLSALPVSVFWGLPLSASCSSPTRCSWAAGDGRRDPPSPGQAHLQYAGQTAFVEAAGSPCNGLGWTSDARVPHLT